MHRCNAVLLHRLSSLHSLNTLGSSHMLKSTSRTEPSLPPHTRDTAPVKSKVAPRFTASQGIDYHSTARTVFSSHHQGRHCFHTGHCTSVNTIHVVITAQVPLHMYKKLSFLVVLTEKSIFAEFKGCKDLFQGKMTFLGKDFLFGWRLLETSICDGRTDWTVTLTERFDRLNF